MIERTITPKLYRMMELYPIVLLTGPRQSGKSTLLREKFPEYQYVSLEDLDSRGFAREDPRGFLDTYPDKTIIDEAQYAPNLFSYLQTHVDLAHKDGMYVLSGSQNFQLMEQISQSLAGRVAILELLPFSRDELKTVGLLPKTIDDEIFMGSYPRLFDKKMHPTEYYPYYIKTYVERDVRQLKNVSDLGLFVKFIKLCAGRIGQLLNYSSLANDCGIAVSTAHAWLSLLETSYIVYRLCPDFNNFSKRLIKSPKLYFHDTGLACSLLEIKDVKQVENHYLKGGLFENHVINMFLKRSYNKGENPQLSFWRDNKGREVDLLETVEGKQFAYEIKSGKTYSSDFLDSLLYWAGLSSADAEHRNIVYGGDKSLKMSNCNLLTINDL
ncbi:ATP-binding protein [Bacteroides heparinolyticus]|uniref:ATP-binding protein n=1 Tax=Prevotella heparinolytica TaxID=28113 RepID=UPI00359F739E